MASLTSALSVAAQGLMVAEAEVSVTNNNISNANTPGYTRQATVISEASPIETGSGISIGDGVNLDGIQSLRDELLTNQIHQQTSQQASAGAQVSALNDVQTLFPTSGTTLSTSLSTFFTSLSALSTNPTGTASRAAVLSNAQSVANQFNTTAAGMTSTQSSLDTQVVTDVNQINTLAAQAASLNSQISQQPANTTGAGTLTDELDQVETSLAGVTNISVVHNSSGGDTITTGNGTPIVIGSQSYALSTSTASDGHQQVLDSTGNNITSSISSGDLGGTIQTRDTTIPGLLSQLDTLANQFATSFNAAQAQGFDQNGNAGTALFSVPTSVSGSAAAISVIATSSTAIAASSDSTGTGDGNLSNLSAVEGSVGPSGSSITNLASTLVYSVGEAASNATTEQTALGQSLTALTTQQSSVSGVSIDEESANLLRFQQAYEASAQVVNTVNSLMSATINMMSASA